jgi:hypothetical protein
MKRIRLLLAAVAAMVWLGANAQSWTGNAPSEGTFFLYNVGAAKFINNGDPNENWGTNAYLQADFGLDFVLESAGVNAYNLNSNVSNGGDSHYLATSTWCDGAATAWTFTAVEGQENTYTISKDGSYLVANDALNDIVYAASTGDNKSWWKLVSLDDFKAAMQAKVYSATDPMNVSVFIQGRSFARNDGRNSTWVRTYEDAKNQKWIENANNQNKYFGNEFWNQTFDIHQEITGLPDGTYEVQCSGFGTNGTTFVYGNTKEGALTSENSAANGSRQTAYQLIADQNAWAGQTTGKFTLSGGNLTVGLKRTTNKSYDWCVYDEFRLYYYGLDLSEFAAALATAVDAAEAVEGTVPAAAYSALAAVVAENNKAWTTAAEYTAATNAIIAATTTAKAMQANFTRYNNVKAAALAVSSNVETTEADAAFAAATTNEEIIAAIATLRSAFQTELAKVEIPTDPGYIDVTAVMVDNASVRQNTNYWTIYNYAGFPNTSYSNGVTNYEETEFYQQQFKFYQTLALTPGTWEFGVTGFHRNGNHSTYFYAGEDKILIPGVASTVVNSMAQAKNYFDEGNGKVALKFLIETAGDVEIGINNQDTQTDRWTIFRDFTLKYYGAPDYSIYETQWSEAVAAADAALATYAEFDGLAATEKTALTTAKGNVPTPEGLKAGYISKIQALTDATAAYIAASQKYQSAKEAIAKANAIKEAHNFASAEAIATFADAIKAISDKYDDLTLTQEEAVAAASTLGVAVSTWHGNANGAASNYLEDGFGLNDFNAALNVNTWSTEGDTDGSNFSVPFYEYWIEDGNSLGEKTWTGTLTNLDNGLYSVSALVRVRAKNGTEQEPVVVTDATGITMSVNGGEAVDVTEGAQVGETRFVLGTFTAQGLVKDGNLTLNFNVAADNNISWLSFKNVKYTKERDLTEEEAAVVPTAIKLFNGEVEVTEPITLDKENTSVTLVAQYEPENATEGLTWSTTDASVATVADGVVTAVTSGTVTITAASTLDENVKATATVVVAFPETEVLEYTNDGATRYVHHYGENIIKNGTFQYNNPFQGWKSGANGNCDANNFKIVTDGDNKYIQATQSMGAGDSHSISTGWPIEPGKTYVFGYKVKASKAGTMQFLVTSLTNTVGTETAQLDTENERKAKPVTTSWTDVKYEFTNSDNYAFVQFRARWMADSQSFDEFYLVEKTADDDVIGNVQYALDAIPAANIGENAFQYSQAAIDAANALVQGEATVEDVEKAYAALTTVNAPADGQLFNVILTYAGWTYDNKAMTYLANGRTDGGLYNIQYKEAANKNLAQAFTFTKVEGNNYKMSQIDADGLARYISTGVPYGGNAGQIRTTTNADEALVVTVIPTATEGVWNLKNTAANQFLGSQDAGVFTVNSHINFQLVETTKPEITINTTAAGYGTTMLPFAVAELPEGVKVYTCDATNGDVLTLTPADAIVANKPYIIEGTWEAVLTGDAQGINLTTTEGLLTGVYAETAAPEGSFVLQNNNGKVGFYRVAEGGQPTVRANHAYLTEAAGARAAYFFGEGVTNGINAIEALTEGNVGIFNAAGVQQPRLQKGLNIVKKADGTSFKVMVK